MSKEELEEGSYEWWLEKFDITEVKKTVKQNFLISFYSGNTLIGVSNTKALSNGKAEEETYDFIQMKKKTGKWPTRCTLKLIAEGEE